MPNGSRPQILIVDDEPAIRTTLGSLLVSAGYDVTMADNGVSAVSQLTKTIPDLIVTDLNMPLMSGIELISHVRSRYPSISIIAMSGDYQDYAAPGGTIADRFYAKGQGFHNLLKTVASLIATSRSCVSAHDSHTSPTLDS